MINMIMGNRGNHENLVIMSEFQAAWCDAVRELTAKNEEGQGLTLVFHAEPI